MSAKATTVEKAKIVHLESETRKSEIEAERLLMNLETDRAQAHRCGVYHFIGIVNEKAVNNCIEAMDMWSRRSPKMPMTLVLNTPGGDVIDGLALYDFIVTDLREQRKHHITTVARGYAASMGGVLLQAGDKRLIGRNAYVLIHEVSRGVGLGKISELEDIVDFSKRLQNRLASILAERSTMSAKEIKTRWERKDWWIDSKEAVRLGFADGLG